MKNLLNLSLVFLLTAPAFAGDRVGNGGDGVALSFIAYTKAIERFLSEEKNILPVPSAVYSRALKTLKVESTDKKLLDKDGTERDALNYPGRINRVTINRGRWQTLSESEQARLTFHEILGLMAIESSNDYHLSKTLQTGAILAYIASSRIPEFCESMIHREFQRRLPDDQFISDLQRNPEHPNTVVDLTVYKDRGNEEYCLKSATVEVKYESVDSCQIVNIFIEDSNQFDCG